MLVRAQQLGQALAVAEVFDDMTRPTPVKDIAPAIVEILRVFDDKQVLSLSPGGRVQEYMLAKNVVFRVRSNDGREWAQPDEITILRTYTYDDSERLAREIQEQRLLREMQSDAVQQIVRRLQSVRPPA